MMVRHGVVFRLKLLWLTMTQPATTVEVEFLPVYVPSEYEKQNPKAFAEGVRNVMAKYAYFLQYCYVLILNRMIS